MTPPRGRSTDRFEALDVEGRVLIQTLLTPVLVGQGDVGVPKIVVLADVDPKDLPTAARMAVCTAATRRSGRWSNSRQGAYPAGLHTR